MSNESTRGSGPMDRFGRGRRSGGTEPGLMFVIVVMLLMIGFLWMILRALAKAAIAMYREYRLIKAERARLAA